MRGWELCSGCWANRGGTGATDVPCALADSAVEQTLHPVILSPTSILLSWNLVPEARGYRLEWQRESGQCGAEVGTQAGQASAGLTCLLAGGEVPQKVVLPSDVTRYRLDGLQPGTEYRLTLYTLLEGREVATPAAVVPTGEGFAAGGGGRIGAWWQPLTLYPLTEPELTVGPVTDLQATELLGQRVRVSWSPVPGATEYHVTVRSTQGEGVGHALSHTEGPAHSSRCTLALPASTSASLSTTSQGRSGPRPASGAVCPLSTQPITSPGLSLPAAHTHLLPCPFTTHPGHGRCPH